MRHLVFVLTLPSNGVIFDLALCIHLHCESIGGPFLPTHFQRILGHMDLWKSSSISKILKNNIRLPKQFTVWFIQSRKLTSATRQIQFFFFFFLTAADNFSSSTHHCGGWPAPDWPDVKCCCAWGTQKHPRFTFWHLWNSKYFWLLYTSYTSNAMQLQHSLTVICKTSIALTCKCVPSGNQKFHIHLWSSHRLKPNTGNVCGYWDRPIMQLFRWQKVSCLCDLCVHINSEQWLNWLELLVHPANQNRVLDRCLR